MSTATITIEFRTLDAGSELPDNWANAYYLEDLKRLPALVSRMVASDCHSKLRSPSLLVHVHADILVVATHFRRLLGGKIIRANAYLSPKVSAILLPICLCLCTLLLTAHIRSLAAGAERSPAQRSAGGAIHSTLSTGALLHNALTGH